MAGEEKYDSTGRNEPSDPHSRALRSHRREFGCFFVTKGIQPRKSILDAPARGQIRDAWLHYAGQKRVLLAAFAVMPDHYHLLFAPLDACNVSKRMNFAGKWIGKQTAPLLARNQCIWQDGFHETRVRSSRQFRAIRHYIHENPVKKGLGDSPEAWEWSSAHPEFEKLMALPWPWRFEQDD